MELPSDIKDRLDKFFPLAADRQVVERRLLTLWETPLNVGQEQLARSILVLSAGEVAEVEHIFNTNFLGDPRDVIMSAEAKSGNPGNYFVDPFSS